MLPKRAAHIHTLTETDKTSDIVVSVATKSRTPLLIDASNVLVFEEPVQLTNYYSSPTTAHLCSVLGVQIEDDSFPFMLTHYGLPVGFLATY